MTFGTAVIAVYACHFSAACLSMTFYVLQSSMSSPHVCLQHVAMLTLAHAVLQACLHCEKSHPTHLAASVSTLKYLPAVPSAGTPQFDSRHSNHQTLMYILERVQQARYQVAPVALPLQTPPASSKPINLQVRHMCCCRT
jgi:hypothetical protein